VCSIVRVNSKSTTVWDIPSATYPPRLLLLVETSLEWRRGRCTWPPGLALSLPQLMQTHMLPQPYIIPRHIIRITFFERIAIALQPRSSHSRVTSPTQFRLRFRRFVTSPQCASGLRFGFRCFTSTVDLQHVLGFRLSIVPLTPLRLAFRFSSFDFVAALQCTCGLRFGFRSLDAVADLRHVFGLGFRLAFSTLGRQYIFGFEFGFIPSMSSALRCALAAPDSASVHQVSNLSQIDSVLRLPCGFGPMGFDCRPFLRVRFRL
jgi:hypothetical protein